MLRGRQGLLRLVEYVENFNGCDRGWRRWRHLIDGALVGHCGPGTRPGPPRNETDTQFFYCYVAGVASAPVDWK